MPALYPVWQALRPSSADAGVDRVTHARPDGLAEVTANHVPAIWLHSVLRKLFGAAFGPPDARV
jgi:hypothetical protein